MLKKRQESDEGGECAHRCRDVTQLSIQAQHHHAKPAAKHPEGGIGLHRDAVANPIGEAVHAEGPSQQRQDAAQERVGGQQESDPTRELSGWWTQERPPRRRQHEVYFVFAGAAAQYRVSYGLTLGALKSNNAGPNRTRRCAYMCLFLTSRTCDGILLARMK